MSIVVKNLTKKYNQQLAVNAINFEASKGEILGFLGPNGAGKSTTMKILTCYLPKSGGKAEVCGYDTEEHPLEVRRRIGYLPEHNPLYKQMYVREYLEFVGRVHQVDNLKKQVDTMIERTGLTPERHKLIGALSKGYRQRVGLAQAMLHNPDVLILDEPTTGLDPNQILEIRNLIKELGKEKTVIFSTHIMQEVQALCDRVVIINKGNIVADDPIEKLQARVSGETVITLELLNTGKQAEDVFRRVKGVKSVKKSGEKRLEISSSRELDIRPDIFKAAVDNQLVIIEMHREIVSIEDVFRSLTQQ